MQAISVLGALAILLEGTWALVSLWGIFAALRGRDAPPGAH
jgi:hypothetical protein